MKCKICSRIFTVPKNVDVVACACGAEYPTGQEKKFRKEFEKICNHLLLPKVTVGRAIAYASAIYELSTHNDRVDTGSIESRVARHLGASAAAEKVSLVMQSQRAYQGLVDSRTGLMIFVVTGRNTRVSSKGQEWAQIYVVFRGSRGDVMGSDKNPYGAGWDHSMGRNVDWNANLDKQLGPAPWAATPIKVHRGFNEIYGSVRQIVHNTVAQHLGKLPSANVIVTGHSLGAAMAILCAHDLHCSGLCEPFCYPFCAPRAGNMHFAAAFKSQIADDYGILWSELDNRSFPRSLIFTQYNDPVSWEAGGGGHGFKNPMSAKSAILVPDSSSIAKQGLYASRKTADKCAIFYHVPNVIRSSWRGLHDYKYMEKQYLPA